MFFGLYLFFDFQIVFDLVFFLALQNPMTSHESSTTVFFYHRMWPRFTFDAQILFFVDTYLFFNPPPRA